MNAPRKRDDPLKLRACGCRGCLEQLRINALVAESFCRSIGARHVTTRGKPR